MSPDANGAHAGEMTPFANTILDGVVLVHILNVVIIALLQHGGILTGALCKVNDQVTHSIKEVVKAMAASCIFENITHHSRDKVAEVNHERARTSFSERPIKLCSDV